MFYLPLSSPAFRNYLCLASFFSLFQRKSWKGSFTLLVNLTHTCSKKLKLQVKQLISQVSHKVTRAGSSEASRIPFAYQLFFPEGQNQRRPHTKQKYCTPPFPCLPNSGGELLQTEGQHCYSFPFQILFFLSFQLSGNTATVVQLSLQKELF